MSQVWLPNSSPRRMRAKRRRRRARRPRRAREFRCAVYTLADPAPPDAVKEKKEEKKTGEDDDAQQGSTKHEDQDGTKLLSTATPLEEAAKILRPLEKLVDRADVWAALYDVAARRSTCHTVICDPAI